jgi:hypothetical protein
MNVSAAYRRGYQKIASIAYNVGTGKMGYGNIGQLKQMFQNGVINGNSQTPGYGPYRNIAEASKPSSKDMTRIGIYSGYDKNSPFYKNPNWWRGGRSSGFSWKVPDGALMM